MLPDSAAIEPLLAERDALRGWLARLDEAGTATPETVRTRVRADYEARLEGLIDRLRSHADTIAGRLEEDRAEFAEHVAALESAEAALAEAELRHAVGEYDSTHFEREQERHGDEIVRCRLGLDAARERIERMESVYDLVTQPVVPVESLAPTPVEVNRSQPTLLDVAPAQTPISEGRFEDALLSVFDEPRDEAPSDEYSPLSFRPGSGMVQDQTRGQPRQSVPSTADVPPLGLPKESLPRFIRPVDAPTGTPVAATAPTAEAERDEIFGGETIVATGPTPELASPGMRTLRCSECSAMNKPLEWYCEKCGAELKAS